MNLGYVNSNHYVSLLPLRTVVSPTTSCDTNVEQPSCADHTQIGCIITDELDRNGKAKQRKEPEVSEVSPNFGRRKLFEKRKQDYSWLTMTEAGNVFCVICSEYYTNRPVPKGTNGTFITIPFDNWKKNTGSQPKDNKLLKHEMSGCHKTAVAVTNAGEVMMKQRKTVYSMVQKQSLDEQKVNLERLSDFFEVAYYLFKNEIPHTTHYSDLLNLVSRLDGSKQLQRFIETSPDNATYASKNTVTEILETVSNHLREDVLNDIRSSPAIALMADESTDLRVRNELSICFRYLADGRSVERFVCQQPMSSTTADSIASSILAMLHRHKIPKENIFWLAFDGAANMAGKKTGFRRS